MPMPFLQTVSLLTLQFSPSHVGDKVGLPTEGQFWFLSRSGIGNGWGIRHSGVLGEEFELFREEDYR